ncbi:hypothetical protein Tco_0612800 [Tanacetum coccineum]
MGTCAPYARREGFTPLIKTPKEILAMDNVNFPPPPSMVGTQEKRNMNKFCDYHQDRGHNTNDCYHLKKHIEEAVASGRLAHLVKDIRQVGQKGKGSAKEKEKVINMVRSQGYQKRPYERVEHWMDNAITFSSVPRYQLMNCPMVVEAMIEGFRVRRIHVDGGSSSEENPMVIMEFAVVKSPSLYNALLGRTGMRSLGVVASNIHSMMKFPTLNRIATISTTRETLRECRQIEEAQDLSRHARVTDPTLMQTSSEVANPRLSLALVETRPRRPGKEPMQLDEQLVTIGGGLSAECRHALIHTLRKNVDIFAWTPTDMTGIPRAITKHSLDTYPYIEPKTQKKRSLTPDRRKVVTDEMTKKDEKKTTFHTEEGVFCYTKMPFGLKNAGATYQRLVDSAFKEQIGVNLEAINMKLNPKKCSFAMEEGKFLVYVVTSEDIRANLEKAKAVMDMPSPKTLKQMQSLSGKLAALNRFLSKSAKRSLPFLDTLKKCTNKKDFRWIEAAEAAFWEMK